MPARPFPAPRPVQPDNGSIESKWANEIEKRSNGVLECWSAGVLGKPILQYSIAPHVSEPRHAGVFLLERVFERRVALGFEGGPVEGGFEAFAVGRAEPELDRDPGFAD